MSLYEPAGQTVCILPDFLRRTPGNDPAAFLSSSRSHIYKVIRIPYDIEIMFDNNQCCPMINEGLENMEKRPHILRMQPYGRPVSAAVPRRRRDPAFPPPV